MAKRRKRINKRVAIILCVVLGLFLTLGVVFYIVRLPKDPLIYIGRADTAFEDGDFALAAQEYGKAIHSGAKDANVFLRAAQASFELANDADLSPVKRNSHYGHGRGYLNSSLLADPDFLDARLLKKQLTWQDVLGSLRRRQQPNWEVFIDEVTLLIELDPENAEAYYQRGLANKALMPSDEELYGGLAQDDFQKAVDLDPTELSYLVDGQIALLEVTGEIEQAQAAYLSAVEKNAENIMLRANFATFLYRTDRKDEALEHIEQAIEIAIEQDAEQKFIAQVVLADYYRWEGRFEEAIETYELAESIDPTMFGAYVTHTRLLKSLRRFEESTEVMRRAMGVAEDMLTGADEAEMSDARRRQLAEALIDLRYRLSDSLLDEIATTPGMDEEFRKPRIQEARDNIKIVESKQDIRPLEPRYYRVLGRIAMYEGDLDEALDNLLKAYQDSKALGRYDEHAGRLLIEIYQRDGQLGNAEDVINEYLRQPNVPSILEVKLAKARVLMRYRNYDDARRLIGEVLDVDSDHANARALMVRLSVELDELRPEDIPEDMALSDPEIEVMIRQALRIWASGDSASALRQMENLHKRAPENLRVVARLIQMYQIVEMTDKAQAVLVEAIKIFPENEALKFAVQLLAASSPANRYQMRLDRAEQIEDPLARALALASVTLLSTDEDRLAQAIVHLKTAAAIDPSASNCLEQMFKYSTQIKDWEQAQWAVDLAIEKNLDRLGGRLYQARLATAQHDDDLQGAIDILKSILRDKPQSKEARLLLGRCYTRTEEYDLAAEAFTTIYDADNSHAAAAIEMMKLMLQQGNAYEAELWIEVAYRLAPYNTDVRNQKIRLMEIRGEGNIDELIARREQGLRMNPQDWQNRFWLAQLYEKAGRDREAERMYVSIYERAPNRIVSATFLVDYYDRVNRQAPVDRIISELLDEVEGNDNDTALVYVLWGQFLGKRSVNAGLKTFDQAIKVAPTDSRPYEPKAALLARHRRWDEAAETMEAGLAMVEGVPDHSEALALAFAKAVVRYRIEGGQFDIAKELIADLMADHADDVALLTLEGILTARQGNNDKAVEMLTAVIEMDSENEYIPARAERARLYMQIGAFGRARDDLKIAADAPGADNGVDMQLGYVYEQMRDNFSAKITYEGILDRTPSYKPAIARLLRIYYDAEDWTRLDALLTDAKRRFPDDPSYYFTEADMWVQRGSPAKNLAALAQAVDIVPNDQATVRRYLLTLVSYEEHQEALKIADKYADRQDFNLWVPAVQARIYVSLGDPDQAEALFANAAAEAQGEALHEVGQQLKAAYGLDGAIARLTDATRAFRQDDWQIRVVISAMCMESAARGQLEAALDLLTEALELAEDQAALVRIYVSLGQVNYLLEDFPATESAYLKALSFETGPTEARIAALNNLAYMYAENLNELDEALKYAAEAARLSPSDPNVLDTYGWTLARLEKYDEAIRYLNRSINIARLPAALFHQGFVHEQTGKRTQAVRNYQEVKVMLADNIDDPLYQQAQEGIERLNVSIAPEE